MFIRGGFTITSKSSLFKSNSSIIFRHFAYLSSLEPLSKNIDFRLLKRRKVRTAASLNNCRFPKFWNFEKSASKSLHSYMLVLRIAFFLKFCYTSIITEIELSLLTHRIFLQNFETYQLPAPKGLYRFCCRCDQYGERS